MPEPNQRKPTAPTPPAKPLSWDSPAAEIRATVRRAEQGDAAALELVRGLLARRGTADCLGGNVAREALRVLVEKYDGTNGVIRESVSRKLEELRAELMGETPTPLERLLVERVVATWLHLHHLEMAYAGRPDLSIPLAGYYQKAISAAQKRYLAGIKGLAEVRKLALPALQINVARRQVNVAGGPVS